MKTAASFGTYSPDDSKQEEIRLVNG